MLSLIHICEEMTDYTQVDHLPTHGRRVVFQGVEGCLLYTSRCVEETDYAPFVRKIEVECETLDMVREAADAGADIIMLDNMTPAQRCV